jgi:CRISPR-associated protein Cmr5
MASLQQTEEQRRAKSAWACVRQVKNELGEKRAGEYRALVRSAATDILTNGLGQTLAFLLAKDKNDKGKHTTPHWALYTHLSAWIPESKSDLLNWLTEQGSDVYRQTTVEVIAYLNWLKRFAEADLTEPKEA